MQTLQQQQTLEDLELCPSTAAGVTGAFGMLVIGVRSRVVMPTGTSCPARFNLLKLYQGSLLAKK